MTVRAAIVEVRRERTTGVWVPALTGSWVSGVQVAD